eukprot:2361327-Rhodomonas_salina.1
MDLKFTSSNHLFHSKPISRTIVRVGSLRSLISLTCTIADAAPQIPMLQQLTLAGVHVHGAGSLGRNNCQQAIYAYPVCCYRRSTGKPSRKCYTVSITTTSVASVSGCGASLARTSTTDGMRIT